MTGEHDEMLKKKGGCLTWPERTRTRSVRAPHASAFLPSSNSVPAISSDPFFTTIAQSLVKMECGKQRPVKGGKGVGRMGLSVNTQMMALFRALVAE